MRSKNVCGGELEESSKNSGAGGGGRVRIEGDIEHKYFFVALFTHILEL